MMNNVSPDTVAQLIYDEFDYFNSPSSLSQTLLEYASRLAEQTSELALAENILGQDLQKYVSSLLKKQQEISKAGIFSPYEVVADNDLIVGFSYPRPSDTSMMRRLRQVAPEISKALEAINQLHHSV